MKQDLRTISTIALGAALAACAPSSGIQGPNGAERYGLAPGLYDAGEASWNMELIHFVPTPPGFLDEDAMWVPPAQLSGPGRGVVGPTGADAFNPILFVNTDLAFSGDRVVMGNFHGFNVFDVTEGAEPSTVLSLVCPGGQGDVSVYGDLVFFSVEEPRGRVDCSGVQDATGSESFRGVRIFDISDLNAPRQVAAVQTCRGSHTHTLVPHPSDPGVVYIYGSGVAGVRSSDELAMCSSGDPEENPDTALFSIDVIKVPLNAPQDAAIVNRPRIFADRETGAIAGLWRGGAASDEAQESRVTNQCHDISAYPAFNVAAGACSGNGILLDISDPENPARIGETFDPNMAYWHSATFNNDATKIVYADEWGGGFSARCRRDDPKAWGADVIVDITDDGLKNRSHYKLPAIQTDAENCVSHNGSIVPVPGRDIFVQGWYSGGVSVFDFTDSANPYEIAYFDRGPVDASTIYLAGHFSAYWHNGRIFASDMVRGLDILELRASEHLSANEIAAARLITFAEANPQTQLHAEWPDHPAVARAYLDQLERGGAVDAALIAGARREIDAWENGRPRADALGRIAGDLDAAAKAADAADADRLRAAAGVLARAG